MLLDRRRVKFWQKIVFSFMAFLMAAFLVVGYSGVLNGCTWFNSAQEDVTEDARPADHQVPDRDHDRPQGRRGLDRLAEAYLSRSAMQTEGSQALTSDLTNAAAAYVKADKLLAKQKGAAVKKQRLDAAHQPRRRLQPARRLAGGGGRVRRHHRAHAQGLRRLLQPGRRGEHRRRHTTAMLAFTRFLELDPKSPYASEVKDWITANAPKTTPTPTPSPTK